MKKIILLTFLFICSIAIADPVTYTENKLGISVTSAEPTFMIKLKSNPTTGYSWFLREYNSDLLIPVQHEFQSSGNTALMGAPGFELWTFKAKPEAFSVPQQTTIRFVYARPWEGQNNTRQLVFRVSMMGVTH